VFFGEIITKGERSPLISCFDWRVASWEKLW